MRQYILYNTVLMFCMWLGFRFHERL